MEISLAKKIYDEMVTHQFVVSIMGNFDQELLLSMLKMTDKKLSSMEIDQSIKKRIFHFMIECAQNLSRVEKADEFMNNSIFLIGKNNDDYIVHLGSVIKSSELRGIIAMIEKVNSIDTEEIKTQYYNELTSTELVKNNSFLISLLGISKRMKDKINYEVIKIDNNNNFLSFKSTISNLKLTDGIYN